MQSQSRQSQYDHWYREGASSLTLSELNHLEDKFFTWKNFLKWYEGQLNPPKVLVWKKIDWENPPKNLVLARFGKGRPYIGYIEIEGEQLPIEKGQAWLRISEHDYSCELVTHYIELSEIENLPFETTK